MKSYQFSLQGLTCEACVKLVKKRLEKISGVTEVEVDLQGNLTIKSERDLEKANLMIALKDTDYKVL
jgi:copper chaperone CopZ